MCCYSKKATSTAGRICGRCHHYTLNFWYFIILSYQCSGMRLGTHQSSEVFDTIIQEITPPFNPYKEEKNLLLKQKTSKNRQISCYIFHLQQLKKKKKLQRKIFYLSLLLVSPGPLAQRKGTLGLPPPRAKHNKL